MQPISTKIKNVTIFKQFPEHETIIEEISSGGTGTYSVGTLGLNSYFNLSIDNQGTVTNSLNINERYYATFETETGQKSNTVWMYCSNNSKTPSFGRTITLGAADKNDTGVTIAEPSGFIQLGELTDITVTEYLTPPCLRT